VLREHGEIAIRGAVGEIHVGIVRGLNGHLDAISIHDGVSVAQRALLGALQMKRDVQREWSALDVQ
jgi:hypothetical protein